MNPKLILMLSAASLWHRKGMLALVTLTLTLSVTLLLGIQYLRTEVRYSFSNTVADTDLIVGARSGQLNLLLYTVFHMGDPTNNVRWDTYQQLTKDSRIDWLVPLSLGDSYRGNRVIGTSKNFPDHFRYGRGTALNFTDGRWFDDVFDVVLGANVARSFRHRVGDEIVLSHGGGRTSFSNHEATPFRVTGVLAPTGTPVDRAVYVSLEGLEAIHIGWESGVAIPGRTVTAEEARSRDLTPSAITAMLMGVERKIQTFQIQRQINQYDSEPLTAILPGVALSELWRLMGQFEQVLLGITGFVVITSLVGVAAVLLTLQVQRQQEITIFRATGARPGLIASLQIVECLILALLSCMLALALGALTIAGISPWILDTWGLQVSLRPLMPAEWLILACVPVAAMLVGVIPAVHSWLLSRKESLTLPTP